MLSSEDLSRLQREQFQHDKRNHFDILHLSKPDRLKHYGLHYCKYVGRLARGEQESKSVERTMTDAFLIVLSAANSLHQELGKEAPSPVAFKEDVPALYVFADAAGRFADACEKIDHLEDFLPIARAANKDLARWVLSYSMVRQFDLEPAVRARRKELATRHFFVTD
jgi:hypothetical protein